MVLVPAYIVYKFFSTRGSIREVSSEPAQGRVGDSRAGSGTAGRVGRAGEGASQLIPAGVRDRQEGKGGDVCMIVVDSHGCMAQHNIVKI